MVIKSKEAKRSRASGRTSHGGNKGAEKILAEIFERKRPFGRFRHRWKKSIKMDHRNSGGCNWINVFQNAASNKIKKWLIFVNVEDIEGSGPDMLKGNIPYDHLERLGECTRNLNR
jgi:hypothetical protein